MGILPDVMVRPIVEAALLEDLGRGGDLTASLIPLGQRLTAQIASRAEGRIAGLACARLAVQMLDPSAHFLSTKIDGDAVVAGEPVARIEADAEVPWLSAPAAIEQLREMWRSADPAVRQKLEKIAGYIGRIRSVATQKPHVIK